MAEPSKIISVAVGVITDAEQRILITQRHSDIPHGGLWEFPGGKIEANETASDGLIREIKEEVGLTVLEHRFLTQIKHCYPDKTVSLMVFHVPQFDGIATCLENQHDLRWVYRSELQDYTFPEANIHILNLDTDLF